MCFKNQQERRTEEVGGKSNQDYYTTSQAARALGVNIRTIRRWTKAGKLWCIYTKGGHRRIPAAEITRLQLLIQAEQDLPVEASEPVSEISDPQLPRYDARVVKHQLKVLKVLLTAIVVKAVLLFAVDGLITLLAELIDEHPELQSLQSACCRLRAEFLGLSTHHQEAQRTDRLIEEEQQCSEQEPCLLSKVKLKPTIFELARAKSLQVFWALTRAQLDEQLPVTERERAQQIIDKILAPYRRLTEYLAKYPPGTVAHEVCKLLLTKHPKDYQLQRRNWSVRTLAEVCQKHLGTKSASKSQVGRFYKRLKWHKPVIPRLMSPDPAFGAKMKHLIHVLKHLGQEDCLLFGDEFKFTSSKIKEQLKTNHAPEGLQMLLKEYPRQYYKPTCWLQISGLLDPQTKRLETMELLSDDFEGYLKTLTTLLRRFLETVHGTVYVILDNGPIHCPDRLPSAIQQIFGDRVVIIFLPTYSPNNNPIERVWKTLLQAVLRMCENESELRKAFKEAKNDYDQQEKKQDPLKIHCQVCGHTFTCEPTSTAPKSDLDEEHLCFNIPDLNPYTVQVLTHSLEVFSLGH